MYYNMISFEIVNYHSYKEMKKKKNNCAVSFKRTINQFIANGLIIWFNYLILLMYQVFGLQYELLSCGGRYLSVYFSVFLRKFSPT